MNSDIRVQVTFRTHPKIKKLERRLGAEAVLCLVGLWIFAAQNKPDGILSGMSVEDIEIAADWSGEFGAFVDVLTNISLLDIEEETYIIHNWERNNPWVAGAEERSKRNSENAKKRWDKCKSHASRMQVACKSHSDTSNYSNTTGDKKNTKEKQVLNATRMRLVESRNAPLLSSPFLTLPKTDISSSIQSTNTEQGSDENDTAQRRISGEIENLHFKAFGRLITDKEVSQIEGYESSLVEKKYQEALERQGTDSEIKFFKWIVNGLEGNKNGKSSEGGFFTRFKSKRGKIGAAYSG